MPAAPYFERTECVAGVQDARFQQLMPDVVHWLGLKRIDRFVSMSDMKHDALTSQGIEIVERVPIPDELVPADAHVEIAAKKAAGYYTPGRAQPKTPDFPVGRRSKNTEKSAALSLEIRETSAALSLLSARRCASAPIACWRSASTTSFRISASILAASTRRRSGARDHAQGLSFARCSVSFALAAFRRQRRRSLGGPRRPRPAGTIRGARAAPNSTWPSSACLLDAGAGPRGATTIRRPGARSAARRDWRSPASPCSRAAPSRRSADPLRADADALANFDVADLARGFQVSDDNPLVGLDGRAALLRRLGRLVAAQAGHLRQPRYAAPGRTVRPSWRRWPTDGQLPAPTILAELLRTRPDLAVAADARRHCARRLLAASVAPTADATSGLVPLHKLSQWLAYSLIEPLQNAGIAVTDIDGLTGLAEYRNGGLFIDTGVLTFAMPEAAQRNTTWPHPRRRMAGAYRRAARPGRGWRAAAAWTRCRLAAARESAGRRNLGRRPRLARERRADGSPPVNVISDGTVFD